MAENYLTSVFKDLISSGTKRAAGPTIGGALVETFSKQAAGKRFKTFAGSVTQDFLGRTLSPLGITRKPNVLGSSRVSTGTAGLGIKSSSGPVYTKPKLLDKVKLTKGLSKSDLKLVAVNKPFQKRWSAQRTSDQQMQYLRDNLSWVQGQMQATNQNFQKVTKNLGSIDDRLTTIDRTIVSIVNQYNKFEKEGLQRQRAEANARSGTDEMKGQYAMMQQNLSPQDIQSMIAKELEAKQKGNALENLNPLNLLKGVLGNLLTGAGVAAGAAGTVVAGKAATKAIEKAAQKRAATKAAQEAGEKAAKKTTEKVVKKQAAKKLGTETLKKFAGKGLTLLKPFAGPAGWAWLTYEIVQGLYALSKSGKPDDRTPATRRGIISRIHAQNPELAAELMKQWVEIRKDASSDAETDRKFIQELAPYIAEKFPDFDFTKYGYTKEGKPKPRPFTPKAGTKPSVKTGPMVTGSLDEEKPEPLTPGYKGYKPLDFNRQFERKQVEEQKSQFLQFGKLPSGFEFLPGHMGRLGTPAAVAATGAMPMSAGDRDMYTGPGSGYTTRGPTEPRSMAYVDPSQTSGYSPGPGAPAWAGTSSQPMKLGGPTGQTGLVNINQDIKVWEGKLPVDRRGRVNPTDYYKAAVEKLKGSKLIGFVPKDGAKFGIEKGTAEEWAAFMTQLTKQESNFNTRTVGDGGNSLGLSQMKGGEYGITNPYDPDQAQSGMIKQFEKYIIKSEHIAGRGQGGPGQGVYGGYRGAAAYFGPLRRQNEFFQHNKWMANLKETELNKIRSVSEVKEPQLSRESATAFSDREMAAFDTRQNVTGGRVIQKQIEKAGIRKKPIPSKLENVLKYAAGKSGVEVEIWSGGQDLRGAVKRGKYWYRNGKVVGTGTTRHGLKTGAADVDLFVSNPETGERRRLNWHNPGDRKYFNEFLKHSAAGGATGFGAGDSYMGAGRLHVGFGTEAEWSSLKHSRTPAFIGMRRAIYQGRKERFDLERAIAEGNVDLSGKVAQKPEEPLVPEGFKPKPAAPTGPEQFAEMPKPKPVAEPPKTPSFREAQEAGMKKEAAIPPPPKPVVAPKEPPKIEPRPKEVAAPKPVPTPEPAKAPEPVPEPAKAAPTGPEIQENPPPAAPTQTATGASGTTGVSGPEIDYSAGSFRNDPESEAEQPGTSGYGKGQYQGCYV
jgi:hypothetical protein